MRIQSQLPVNGHKLYVESEGPLTGDALVFLHHGLGSVYAWRAQIPVFASAGFGVIAYDRWGYGQSEPRTKLSLPYFEDDLGDLETLLDLLNLSSVVLIGHSDGGTIALFFAAAQPERVSCLVTVAAHIYIEPKMLPGIQELRQSFENEARFRDGLRRLHGEKFESVFYNWYQGWVNPDHLDWDMRAVIQRITCPALVVQGEKDEHAAPQHARHIAENIPGAQLWLQPGVGHMLPQDKPIEFNTRVLSFVNSVLKEA